METINSTFDWHTAILETWQSVYENALSFAPKLIAALALLGVGILIAKLMSAFTHKMINSLDFIFKYIIRTDDIKKEKIKQSSIIIIGNTVFWIIMMFFVAVTANMLDWNLFSSWMVNIINYLPHFIIGLTIILTGFLLGNIVKIAINNSSETTALEHYELFARAAQIFIVIAFIVIGIEQVGVNVTFLTNIITIAIGVTLLGGAIAFGLGAKSMVSNILGSQYFKKHFNLGDIIILHDNKKGRIIDIAQTAITIESTEKKLVVPAKYFQENISIIINE